MKSLLLLISLTVTALCSPAPEVTLYPAPQPLHCVGVGDFVWDFNCLGYPWRIMIPDFWLSEAMKLDDWRFYDNYEKIICSNIFQFSICAFFEGANRKVPGYQIKNMVKHLAHSCDKSRCAVCDLREASGPAYYGVFKIDGVKSMGECSGVCSPEECEYDSTEILSSSVAHSSRSVD